MARNLYALCPCGSGKKTKFCCRDIADDVEKVQKMVEGDQRIACLQFLRRMPESTGNRAFMLSTRIFLEIESGEFDTARQTLIRFSAKHSDNPLMFAATALINIVDEDSDVDLRKSVEAIHRAIEHSGRTMSTRVYEIIGLLVQVLAAEGHVAAAIAHLMLQVRLTGGKDKNVNETILRMRRSPGVPLFVKEPMTLAGPRQDTKWKEPFTVAWQQVGSHLWRKALEGFQALAEEYPDQPEIIRNVAALSVWMARDEQAVEYLRRYASMDVPDDDAVEAEALAQWLEQNKSSENVDAVAITYPLGDEEDAWTKLMSDRRASSVNFNAEQTEDDEPPPRAVFWILDSPLKESGVDIKREEISNVLAQAFLYGKQTDRDARIELMTHRDANFDKCVQILSDICGDSISDVSGEEVLESIPRVRHELSWRWKMPDDTPSDHHNELIDSEHQEIVLKHWPTLKMSILDDKSPNDVADDEAYRTRLSAAVLLMDLMDSRGSVDYNTLRESLKIPTPQPIDPAVVDPSRLTLIQLRRLDVSKLTDEQLPAVFQRAYMHQVDPTAGLAARAIIDRPALYERIPPVVAYQTLVSTAASHEAAMEAVAEAKEYAAAAGKSNAEWDLQEISLQLDAGNIEPAITLAKHVEATHMKEPGIGRALVGLLSQYGLMGPPGGAPVPAEGEAMQPQEEEEEAGKIWTPDSPGESGEKKAIWTPD